MCIGKSLETYFGDMRKVAVSIVRFIAMELGLEAQKFPDTYKEGTYDVTAILLVLSVSLGLIRIQTSPG